MITQMKATIWCDNLDVPFARLCSVGRGSKFSQFGGQTAYLDDLEHALSANKQTVKGSKWQETTNIACCCPRRCVVCNHLMKVKKGSSSARTDVLDDFCCPHFQVSKVMVFTITSGSNSAEVLQGH